MTSSSSVAPLTARQVSKPCLLKTRKEKTTPLGVSLLRSPLLPQAAQFCCSTVWEKKYGGTRPKQQHQSLDTLHLSNAGTQSQHTWPSIDWCCVSRSMDVALVLASAVFQELGLCPSCMPCFAAGRDRCIQRDYTRTIYSKLLMSCHSEHQRLTSKAEVIWHMHRSGCGTFQTSVWWTGRTCMKW